MYKYVLQEKSPFCKVLRDVLNMFGVPAENVNSGGECFAVVTGPKTHNGLVPLVSALRKTAVDAKLKEFVGAAPDVAPLVNQWLLWASLVVSNEPTQTFKDSGCTSFMRHLLLQVEKCIDLSDGKKGFLTGGTFPTIADLLLYVAVHNHPLWTPEAYPCVKAWALHTRSNERVAPLIPNLEGDAFSQFTPVATGGRAGATGGGKAKGDKPVFAKPSDEEILRRKQEKEKAKLAKAANAAASAATAKDGISSPEKKKEVVPLNPNQLDLRVGRFLNVRRHPNSDRLFVEDMDIGTETRTVVSGLVDHYKAEEVEGTLCITVCNLKPRSLRDINSHGMILCASNETSLRIVQPPEGAKPGDRILFGEAYNKEALLETKQLSGNAATGLLGPLRVDDQSIVRWGDIPAQHPLGVLTVPGITNAIVK
ncbi:tyrosyl-tRNA synthetase, putative [Trypanosoma brucei gambiense DAL972]|uniref:Tyrosyl-tRNA synthetase, putative n=1 Tax=Trypanosoma brucei gambiense (strain MHOM/CI/86/DAL972) TaxID=679716 RepID=C9ZRK5_TRYB9|nr:tyrosyl-tRNA synthetase, putative [Trypanosoma brucei gambiense DAL972]CBH12307.1 tyrosyl-tRNA synthetase, putative [Trypanosoma brucei gambiense DAL972]|eukprot:XP_011774588.1 tyrosyl-tRNA synthetase, putative [Trypanosoma brucei gambiense DAL972]